MLGDHQISCCELRARLSAQRAASCHSSGCPGPLRLGCHPSTGPRSGEKPCAAMPCSSALSAVMGGHTPARRIAMASCCPQLSGGSARGSPSLASLACCCRGLCPTACPRARQAGSTRGAAGRSRRLESALVGHAGRCGAARGLQHRPRPLDVAASACWRGRAVARGCPLPGRDQRPPSAGDGACRGPPSACKGVSAGRPARRFAQLFSLLVFPRPPYGGEKTESEEGLLCPPK